ncbi:hypothetical protein VCRA2130O400_690002 [Vibrio crassostreae]|nr:hypothetical protein VCRA2130O400_690002 [Vibrio crassostreae]
MLTDSLACTDKDIALAIATATKRFFIFIVIFSFHVKSMKT